MAGVSGAAIDAVVALLRVAEQLTQRLEPVLKAVEWQRSGDTGIDDTIKATREYAEKSR